MFNESKYTSYYFNIIENAKIRILPLETIIEKHHIIPKSLRGSNSRNNLIDLTPREHYLCHWLLTKMTTNKNDQIKMSHALWCMINTRTNIKIPSRLYEKLRKNHSKLIQGRNQKENNHFYGKHHTEATKQKLSEQRLGKTWEEIQGTKAANIRRQKVSEAKKGITTWNKGISPKIETINQIKATIRKNKDQSKVFKWWEITLPDGSVQTTNDRRIFCQEHNLNYNTINDYTRRGKSFRGYFFKEISPPLHSSNH